MTRTETLPVTYKDQRKDVTYILYGTLEEYDASRTGHPKAWYEHLGIRPRGWADTVNNRVHLSEPNVKLLAHETLHLFDIHHPGRAVKAIVHAVSNGFPMASFTGLLRWNDVEGILPEATRVLKRLTR